MWSSSFFFFFFNDTATTEIYTLSLHDALPICFVRTARRNLELCFPELPAQARERLLDRHFESLGDRKSTRLNSSHLVISYAVFCLKKKKKKEHGTLDDTESNKSTHIVCRQTAC